MNDIMVFSLTSNTELVKDVCRYLSVEPGKIKVSHFKDGETLVEPQETVRGKQVFIVQSTYNPVNEKLMEVLIAIDAIKRASAAEITCVIPYFGYARQDRKASPRQPITSKLVANLLETAGANRVIMLDLHATQIQGFFNCPTDNFSTIPMMANYFLSGKYDLENTVVVSPDHGGTTRARKMADLLNTPMAIVDKRRPRPNVCEATGVVGDVNGKDCIVVDDICDTGGSLVAACNILKEHGANRIFVSIAHGVFSDPAIERIEESCIEEMVITDTIPLSEDKKAKTSKITVLPIAWLISRLIDAVAFNKPVSDVYNTNKI